MAYLLLLVMNNDYRVDTYLSYINNVPCNRVKLGISGSSFLSLSASARKSLPLEEISPGTT
jgi:hypothetical protein